MNTSAPTGPPVNPNNSINLGSSLSRNGTTQQGMGIAAADGADGDEEDDPDEDLSEYADVMSWSHTRIKQWLTDIGLPDLIGKQQLN